MLTLHARAYILTLIINIMVWLIVLLEPGPYLTNKETSL